MESRRQQSVYFLYGSQTGNAESIAQDMQQAAVAKGIPAIVDTLNSFNTLDPPLTDASVCVIVCSTTGNGDSPENSEKFWRFVKRRAQPKDLFSGLSYTVLGLGDTNYDKFNYMGKNIHSRLADLGATTFYDSGFGDEATGLEETVDPWIDGLWPALRKVWFGDDTASGEEKRADTNDAANGESEPKKEEEPCGAAHGRLCLPPNIVSVEAYAVQRGVDVLIEPEANDVPKLRASRANVERVDPSVHAAAPPHATAEWTSEAPYAARIVSAKYITAEEVPSDRRVIHAELDLGDSKMNYEPGDAIGIQCPNSDFDVSVVLNRLQQHHSVAADSIVIVRGTSCAPSHACSVDELVRFRLDLHSSPRKPLLRALAEHCADPKDRNQLLWLCSKKEKDLYAHVIERQQLTLGELLFMLPSCAPPLDVLLSVCPPMPPRYYSIASSPLVDPRRVAVAFSIVRFTLDPTGAQSGDDVEGVIVDGIPRVGLCTTWLERLCAPLLSSTQSSLAPITVRTFMKPTKDFRLPGNLKWPLILIGPGTGVAPFIGFLAHRAAQSKLQEAVADEVCCGYWRGGYEIEMKGEESEIDEFRGREGRGPAWLFFGCRHPDQDWIYKHEMQHHLANSVLTSLHTAFSRAQKEKQYVQDLMLQNSEELCRLITQEGAYVYICGDGNRMAKDVHSCLKSILVSSSGMDDAAAESYLQDMKQHARFLLDIWS